MYHSSSSYIGQKDEINFIISNTNIKSTDKIVIKTTSKKEAASFILEKIKEIFEKGKVYVTDTTIGNFNPTEVEDNFISSLLVNFITNMDYDSKNIGDFDFDYLSEDDLKSLYANIVNNKNYLNLIRLVKDKIPTLYDKLYTISNKSDFGMADDLNDMGFAD